MPQLFSANWIELSVSLILTICLSLTFIYSLLFFLKAKRGKISKIL